MNEAATAWSSPTFSRTGGFPVTAPSAAPCTAIAARPPSISLVLITAGPGCYSFFQSINDLIQHPKTASSGVHPGLPLELMERYRHSGCEASAVLWDGLNHALGSWGRCVGRLPNTLTLVLGGREEVRARCPSCCALHAVQMLWRSNLLQEQGWRVCCLPPFQGPALP